VVKWHWGDGWMFERTEDGSVAIYAPPLLAGHQEPSAIVPPNEWASIVAWVSARPDAPVCSECRRLREANERAVRRMHEAFTLVRDEGERLGQRRAAKLLRLLTNGDIYVRAALAGPDARPRPREETADDRA
jgi:hypothetical protein